MNTNEYSIAFSEVLDILQHSELEVIEKIPLEVIKNIKEKASTEYISKINDTDKEFTISKKAKAILAVIYQDYLCDEEETEEFRKKLIDNEIKHQNQLRKQHNPEKIFEKREIIGNDKNAFENTQIKPYKESLFRKVLNKIRLWF